MLRRALQNLAPFRQMRRLTDVSDVTSRWIGEKAGERERGGMSSDLGESCVLVWLVAVGWLQAMSRPVSNQSLARTGLVNLPIPHIIHLSDNHRQHKCIIYSTPQIAAHRRVYHILILESCRILSIALTTMLP